MVSSHGSDCTSEVFRDAVSGIYLRSSKQVLLRKGLSSTLAQAKGFYEFLLVTKRRRGMSGAGGSALQRNLKQDGAL